MWGYGSNETVRQTSERQQIVFNLFQIKTVYQVTLFLPQIKL